MFCSHIISCVCFIGTFLSLHTSSAEFRVHTISESSHYNTSTALKSVTEDSSELYHTPNAHIDIPVNVVEVSASLLGSLVHGLLALSDPDSRVVVLLVGLVGSLGVTDLGLEVTGLALEVVSHTDHVGPLGVGVDVHLDDTVLDGGLDLVLLGTGSTVEDQEQGLLTALALQLLTSEFLVLAQQFRSEGDVSGLVDTVDVTESGSDGEVGGDRGQGLVDLEDLVRLRVQRVVVGTSVVDTILFTTGQTDFHLEPFCKGVRIAFEMYKISILTVHLGHSLEVLDTGLDVLLVGLFRQVDHVGTTGK
jgi:hypothetical protein